LFRFTSASSSPLFPYTTLFRSVWIQRPWQYRDGIAVRRATYNLLDLLQLDTISGNLYLCVRAAAEDESMLVRAGDAISRPVPGRDRKSTRLNSSHLGISYAVFC